MHVPAEIRVALGAAFTVPETLAAILLLASGKAGGLEGHPSEFLKDLAPLWAPIICRVLNASVDVGFLPLTMRFCTTTLALVPLHLEVGSGGKVILKIDLVGSAAPALAHRGRTSELDLDKGS